MDSEVNRYTLGKDVSVPYVVNSVIKNMSGSKTDARNSVPFAGKHGKMIPFIIGSETDARSNATFAAKKGNLMIFS